MVRLSDAAAERKPVFARHHDVENDRVDTVLADRLARGLRVLGGERAAAVLLQELNQRLAYFAMIVDHQDQRVFRRHGQYVPLDRQKIYMTQAPALCQTM